MGTIKRLWVRQKQQRSKRLTRKEFWYAFPLVYILSEIFTFFTLEVIRQNSYIILVSIILILLTAIPTLLGYFLLSHRLHDIGKSNSWVWALFVLNVMPLKNAVTSFFPVIYLLFLLLVFCTRKSGPDNKYGPQWE